MRLVSKKRVTWLTVQPGLSRTTSRIRRRLALASARKTASIESPAICSQMVTYLESGVKGGGCRYTRSVMDQLSLPPYLTSDLPGVGGRLKSQPEDFEVEEI